ncbi:MAG: 16S rRNA (guanine(527)-N(7))-methyltransferase RsmG [Candidatus Acidiferrales bacterium]
MAETLGPYGVDVTPRIHYQVLAYMSLLQRWSQRISLTAVSDPFEILRFHFGESFFAGAAVPILDGRLADVGSGAGFPGLPLKMLRPKIHLTLIEANLKKCAFLSEVIRILNLDHVSIVRGRMEAHIMGHERFDIVTARAVGQTRNLLRFAGTSLTEIGKMVFWLGEHDIAEMAAKEHSWQWDTPREIPGSERRFLLVGARPQGAVPRETIV